MSKLPFLAQQLFNTPLALHPAKAEVVVAQLADRFGITRLFAADGHEVQLARRAVRAEEAGETIRGAAGYSVYNGVAFIKIRGTLVQELGCLTPFSGMTGYDGIRQNFLLAQQDPSVEAIMLDINSPGGEVAGCFDLVDLIYSARGRKPIAAALSENAYSAAYALASAADPGLLFVPRTGGTGSVGVIYLHVDQSNALDDQGLVVSMITYGEEKGDGSDTQPLSPRARARLQADVDAVGRLFDATVARNRGLKANVVRAQEARTFLGAEGVEIGFADAVSAPDAAFRRLLKKLR